MRRADLAIALAEVLADRQLLAHPFYQRWQSGRLDHDELRRYAGQYRHFEMTLPAVLRATISRIGDDEARRLVDANLADEEGRDGVPHIDLFDQFALALGARLDDAATPATATLLATYTDASHASAAEGLAAVLAYECQSPAIARSKGEGLRAHYRVAQTGFWDLHADIDGDHATWALDALTAMIGDDDPRPALLAARRAADSWWAFLDERETEKPAVVTA